MEIKIIGTSSELATFLRELATGNSRVLDEIKVTTENTDESSNKKSAKKPKAIVKKATAKGSRQKKNTSVKDKELTIVDKNTVCINGVNYTTASNLAKMAGVDVNTIYYYKKANKISFELVNDINYFSLEDFEKLSGKIGKKGKKRRVAGYTKQIEKSPFAKWKLEIHALCKKSSREEGKVLSDAYKKLNKVYGIVYDQLRKDFYKVNEYSCKSTLELIYWLQTNDKNYKGLIESVITDIVENEKA